tara:strand:+ start:16248 stop:18707 length:2460 start_codon:yes stop_codon:yes gene_type:complete
MESHPKDQIVIIGESPGGHETMERRPFVGPAGMELQDALDSVGVGRDECQLNNAIACQPEGKDLEAHLIQASRRNKKRKKAGEELLLTPMAACHGRLLNDIEGFKKIICLGGRAASAIRGRYQSITSLRGGCETIAMPWGDVAVSYTLHPNFVLRSPKWRPVFQNDIAKALRFFSGKLTWADPEVVFPRSESEVLTCLTRLRKEGKPIAYDVETDAKNPLLAKLRCIGFANEDFAFVVPLLSIDGRTKAYSSQAEWDRVADLLREFLVNCPEPLIGHNAGQYDRLVVEKQLGITPSLRADTLLLHLLTDNEMPHNLGFVGSFYTDFTESWKSDHTALNARTDEELYLYCAKDCAVTARISPPLGKSVRDRNQWTLLAFEHQLQDIACGMQKLGLYVDFDKVEEHQEGFESTLSKHASICTEIGPADFNPNSTAQLRRLLFNSWKLAPVKYNEKTGDPSTDDETLRKMLTTYALDEEKNLLIQSVRMYRRYTKLLGTYIHPLRERLVLEDGRIHPSYNRLPATGRYSSSSPNAQNIPYLLRDIFVPEEGHVFIGADMDQLELRLIAEEAEAVRLLEIINSGLDPHNETMEVVFGKSVWALEGAPGSRKEKGDKIFKATRGITKNVRYAWQYAASVPTIYEQVTSVEDGDGKLIYAHLTLQDVRQVVNGLKRADPEIPRWWNTIRNRYRREGHISDSIWGRRRDFRDEEKINELVNHPVQAGGASIVHESMLQLVLGDPGLGTVAEEFENSAEAQELFQFDFENKTGLVNQCHDSLVFEIEEDKAEGAAKLLQQAMTRKRRKGAQLLYTAEAEIGTNWKEV